MTGPAAKAAHAADRLQAISGIGPKIETLLKDTFKGQEFTIAPTETGESAAALGFGRRPICKACSTAAWRRRCAWPRA